MSRKETVWVLMSDWGEGEGPVTIATATGMMPLFTTSEENVPLLRQTALRLTGNGHQPIKLAEFTRRVDIAEFNPPELS